MVDDQAEDILEGKSPQTKKLMLVIIIISVLFMGIMGAGFYILWSKVSPPEPEVEQGQAIGEEKAEDDIKPVVSLDAFVVNLADRGGTRYLRTTMDLEVSNEDTKAEIEKRLPQIRNAVLMIIPSKSSREIRTLEGKTELRDQILEKLNSFITSGKITNIYFTEFVIQ